MPWYKTAAERHGQAGVKGRSGELIVLDWLKSAFGAIVDHEDDRAAQMRGIDVSYQIPGNDRWYTGDIKSNMNEAGRFFVETRSSNSSPVADGWLYKSKADRLFHVCLKSRLVCCYSRVKMIKIVESIYNNQPPPLEIVPVSIHDSRYKQIIWVGESNDVS